MTAEVSPLTGRTYKRYTVDDAVLDWLSGAETMQGVLKKLRWPVTKFSRDAVVSEALEHFRTDTLRKLGRGDDTTDALIEQGVLRG